MQDKLPTQVDFLSQEVARLTVEKADLQVALFNAYARIEQLEGGESDAIRSAGENTD